MNRNYLWTGIVLVLTTAGLCLAPSTADAQRRYQGNRGDRIETRAYPYWGGYGYNRGYYNPRYYTYGYPWYYYYGPTYVPRYTYVPPATGYDSEVTTSVPIATTPVQAVTTAHFIVHVPASDAQVWIDGRLTTQTGTERHFQTPPLDLGATFSYVVRAQWLTDGVPHEQTRMVSFQAGDTTTVDFTGAAAE